MKSKVTKFYPNLYNNVPDQIILLTTYHINQACYGDL